jgi:hypothetical protein
MIISSVLKTLGINRTITKSSASEIVESENSKSGFIRQSRLPVGRQIKLEESQLIK